ncbi:hypothetical protein C8T65DRAFT_636491, partial [Cerioporus squamosus]
MHWPARRCAPFSTAPATGSTREMGSECSEPLLSCAEAEDSLADGRPGDRGDETDQRSVKLSPEASRKH